MKLPPPFADDELVNVIIETPEGSPNKYKYDARTGLYKLSKVIPTGLSFPLAFGFVPGTKAEDGDPLDALVLLEEPTWPGIWVEARVLGVIEAEQTEGETTVRNDRILTAAVASRRFGEVRTLSDLDELPGDIVSFFQSYHEREGKTFRALRIAGAKTAIARIKELS